MKIVRNIIHYLTEKPKTLFLIDSLGAMLTALFLFAVLRNFNNYFGMPKPILTYLSAIAACFSVFSAFCFLFLQKSWVLFIKVISFANLLYCILIMVLLIMYYSQLTIIGMVYFIIEIIIIGSLASIELNVSAEIRRRLNSSL